MGELFALVPRKQTVWCRMRGLKVLQQNSKVGQPIKHILLEKLANKGEDADRSLSESICGVFIFATILITELLFSFVSSERGLSGDFPPFLPFPERLPVETRSEVVSVWNQHTLRRAVNGRPARASLDLFHLFMDLPEVTVAASHHLGLGKYWIRKIGSASYEFQDPEGPRGTFTVLFQDLHRRVILARGSHPGWIFGRIAGASLTQLTFTSQEGADGRPRVAQHVDTFVRIDNRIAAFFIRVSIPIFSRYADRKLAEGFNVTARVSAWAYENPRTFCHWLGSKKEVSRYRTNFASYCRPA